MKVKHLDEKFTLVQQGQEIAEILQYCGKPDASYGVLFVEVGDADYISVYGARNADLETKLRQLL